MSNSENVSLRPTTKDWENAGLFVSIWLVILVVIFFVLRNFELLHPLSLLSCNALVFIFFTAISENFPKIKLIKWLALFFNVLLLVVAIATLPSKGLLKEIKQFDGPKTIWSERFE